MKKIFKLLGIILLLNQSYSLIAMETETDEYATVVLNKKPVANNQQSNNTGPEAPEQIEAQKEAAKNFLVHFFTDGKVRQKRSVTDIEFKVENKELSNPTEDTKQSTDEVSEDYSLEGLKKQVVDVDYPEETDVTPLPSSQTVIPDGSNANSNKNNKKITESIKSLGNHVKNKKSDIKTVLINSGIGTVSTIALLVSFYFGIKKQFESIIKNKIKNNKINLDQFHSSEIVLLRNMLNKENDEENKNKILDDLVKKVCEKTSFSQKIRATFSYWTNKLITNH